MNLILTQVVLNVTVKPSFVPFHFRVQFDTDGTRASYSLFMVCDSPLDYHKIPGFKSVNHTKNGYFLKQIEDLSLQFSVSAAIDFVRDAAKEMSGDEVDMVIGI